MSTAFADSQQSPSQPSLLPSPFNRPDENTSPDPQPVQATSASIYSPEPEHSDYPPADEGSLLPPPTFNPLFTLVSDTTTGEFYHPSTYYVFSDDETAVDSVGAAALHALETYSHDALSKAARGPTDANTEIEERYLIVDLAGDAARVSEAQSLAPSWAVTAARISAAPMFGAQDNGQDGSMMLMIEGVGSGREQQRSGDHDSSQRAKLMLDDARSRVGGSITGAMGDVLTSVNKDLDMLDKILGLGPEPG